jgi:hypothetical protein
MQDGREPVWGARDGCARALGRSAAVAAVTCEQMSWTPRRDSRRLEAAGPGAGRDWGADQFLALRIQELTIERVPAATRPRATSQWDSPAGRDGPVIR